jgi:hypothetical protein
LLFQILWSYWITTLSISYWIVQVSIFHDQIKLLFQFIIELVFQFNTIPIQKRFINCKDLYSLQLGVSCHLLQITKFSKASWSLVAKNKFSTTRCLTMISLTLGAIWYLRNLALQSSPRMKINQYAKALNPKT